VVNNAARRVLGPLLRPHRGSLALACGLALLGLLELATRRMAEDTAERVGAEPRSEIFSRAMTRSLRFHDRMRSGELVSRLTTDVGRVLDALVAVTTTLVPDLLLVASILAVLATLDVELAMVGLSVVPALAWCPPRRTCSAR